MSAAAAAMVMLALVACSSPVGTTPDPRPLAPCTWHDGYPWPIEIGDFVPYTPERE